MTPTNTARHYYSELMKGNTIPKELLTEEVKHNLLILFGIPKKEGEYKFTERELRFYKMDGGRLQ